MEKVNVTLTINQLNIILGSLGKAPYEAVFTVIDEINKQVVPQLQNMPQQHPETD